jgi:hypothetical protein
MIRITVELHSYRTGKVTKLGQMDISNDGTSMTTRRGTYDADIWLKRKKPWRTAHVADFPRLSRNVWYLVYQLLGDALGHPRR